MSHSIPLATLLTASIALNSAYALTCGQSITTPGVVNLTANLGPCPGNGLIVERSGVTINLNGFKIIGASSGIGTAGSGVSIPNGGGTGIYGPGEISGFGTGIRAADVLSSQTGLTIYNVNLARNGTGIFLNIQNDALVFGNTITQGGVGISANGSSGVTIAGNTITGSSGIGISVFATAGTGITISNNVVNGNSEGLVADTGNVAGLQMRVTGNQFNSNNWDGARVPMRPRTGLGPIVFLGNTLNGNGNHGLNFTSSEFGAISNIRGNVSNLNRRYGIITTGDGWRVVGNTFTGNMWYDIYWSGVGDSCYSNNIFATNYNHLPLLPCQ